MSHYDTLGVADDASTAEIRESYRRLARRHHPDRGERDATAMAEINEAYRVLGEPGRRAVYDAGRRGPTVQHRSTSGPPATAVRPPPHSVDTTPARYPWKLVIGMAALGITIVLIGAALYEPAKERPPDNLLETGSCVVIEANGDAREINCSGPDDLVVAELVAIDARCPDGTEGHRDRQGRGLACIVGQT